MKKSIVLCAFALASGLAIAQQPVPRFYVGASVGEAYVNGMDTRGLSGISQDESDTAFKFFGGYQFNQWFAVEGGYADFGKYTLSAVGNGSLSGSSEGSAWFVDAVGHLNANPSFSVFGKAGLAYARAKTQYSYSNVPGFGSGSYSASENNAVPKLGVGLRYNFTPMIGVRAEYEKYFNVGDDATTGESDVDMWSIGMTVNF